MVDPDSLGLSTLDGSALKRLVGGLKLWGARNRMLDDDVFTTVRLQSEILLQRGPFVARPSSAIRLTQRIA